MSVEIEPWSSAAEDIAATIGMTYTQMHERNTAEPEPAPLSSPHFIRHARNEHAVWYTVMLCGACGSTFTNTPAIRDDTRTWDNCLAIECPSYDINRDVEALMVTDGATIHADVI